MRDRLTIEHARTTLDRAGREFVTLFGHGSLEVEIYRPVKVDRQQPHGRDELYVVISGTGLFVNGATRRPFQAGEVLFVPAGIVHRFEEFSDDFLTWVFFYGPEGGEAPGARHAADQGESNPPWGDADPAGRIPR